MSHEIEVKFSVPGLGMRGKKTFALVSKRRGSALTEIADYRARQEIIKGTRTKREDVVIESLSIC